MSSPLHNLYVDGEKRVYSLHKGRNYFCLEGDGIGILEDLTNGARNLISEYENENEVKVNVERYQKKGVPCSVLVPFSAENKKAAKSFLVKFLSAMKEDEAASKLEEKFFPEATIEDKDQTQGKVDKLIKRRE